MATEKTFSPDEMIVSKTDLKGNIVYGNKLFIEMSEYSEGELLGKPHNIIRHPDMPAVIFKYLWSTISQGDEVNAYVVNRSKYGNYYWVFANVTPSFNHDHKIIGYHSARRKPKKESVEAIKPIYKTLLQSEKSGGLEKSLEVLTNLLEKEGVTYEEFIFNV